jgi:predicted dehydrogenase/threonine dehydrogenase-like Zn-dependent dehydrogenase
MHQVIQSYRTGAVSVADVPVPCCSAKGILVRNRTSLISLGTERATIELGRMSLIGKARARPDLVKRVIDKARRDGLKQTYEAAIGRLDAPTALGYSCAGEVLQVGISATEFSPGDRVTCIGQGFASHADFVSVPANLAAKIPDGVSYDEAAFGMLGVIALHGVRSAKVEFGSSVAVLGLGLLGLLTVQLLRAYGCRVVCMDPDPEKVTIAAKLGADAVATSNEALELAALAETAGFGCDAVIVTAATKSDAPIHAAVRLCRQKGRIVVVGIADIHPDRNELWSKEIELVVSRAAGPGSLDPLYEQEGVDLPIGDVRWTENRNLQEFLRLVASKRIDLSSLLTHRFPIGSAAAVYAGLIDGSIASAVGVLLDYPTDVVIARRVAVAPTQPRAAKDGSLRIGVVGAGLFGKSVLLPTLEKLTDVSLEVLSTASGASAMHNAKRFGFKEAATDASELFASKNLDAVVVATPHDQHASAVISALAANKPLFLEKPLCVTNEELDDIAKTLARCRVAPIVMVGHNRRYSPHTAAMRAWLKNRKDPLVLSMRINAGFVPPDHWVHSERQGRSRIVGEMTHFLDLICALCEAHIRRIYASRVAGDGRSIINNDNLSVTLEMTDGSVATLVYSAQGARATPREQIEIFSAGRTVTSVDFKTSCLSLPTGRQKKFRTSGSQSGYTEELRHFVDCVRGRAALTPSLDDMLHVMKAAFAMEDALALGKAITLEAQ